MFKEIASTLVEVSHQNPFLAINRYSQGTMTDVVYWVNGGLEDWSYAAGWENTIDGYSAVVECTP